MNKLRAVPRDELEVHGMRVIESAIGDEVAYVAFDEDADFIVKACNAHEQLVEALTSMDLLLLDANPNCSPEFLFGQIQKAFNIGRAALEQCK